MCVYSEHSWEPRLWMAGSLCWGSLFIWWLCSPLWALHGGTRLVSCQPKWVSHLSATASFGIYGVLFFFFIYTYSCASWQPSVLVAFLAHTYTNFLPLWWLLLWDHCGLISSTEYWGTVLISVSPPEWNWSYQGPFSVSWDGIYYDTIYYFIDLLF